MRRGKTQDHKLPAYRPGDKVFWLRVVSGASSRRRSAHEAVPATVLAVTARSVRVEVKGRGASWVSPDRIAYAPSGGAA